MSSSQSFLSCFDENFNFEVAKTFLEADIPLYKLNHPSVKRLFQQLGKQCPSESSCRSKVKLIGEKQKQEMKANLSGKGIFLVVDEAIVQERRILCILVGAIDSPCQTHVLECVQISTTNNASVVCQAVDDALRFLETKRDDFNLLLSDAAPYMTAAGGNLKLMYSNLFHVTCVSHLFHNCCMKIRSNCTEVDDLIASIKALVCKNKSRLSAFSEIGFPPEPVITRWGTWLSAAMHYAQNLPTVKAIVENLDGSGLILSRAKQAVNAINLATQLTNISKYKSLENFILKSEKIDYSINDAFTDINNISFC